MDKNLGNWLGLATKVVAISLPLLIICGSIPIMNLFSQLRYIPDFSTFSNGSLLIALAMMGLLLTLALASFVFAPAIMWYIFSPPKEDVIDSPIRRSTLTFTYPAAFLAFWVVAYIYLGFDIIGRPWYRSFTDFLAQIPLRLLVEVESDFYSLSYVLSYVFIPVSIAIYLLVLVGVFAIRKWRAPKTVQFTFRDTWALIPCLLIGVMTIFIFLLLTGFVNFSEELNIGGKAFFGFELTGIVFQLFIISITKLVVLGLAYLPEHNISTLESNVPMSNWLRFVFIFTLPLLVITLLLSGSTNAQLSQLYTWGLGSVQGIKYEVFLKPKGEELLQRIDLYDTGRCRCDEKACTLDILSRFGSELYVKHPDRNDITGFSLPQDYVDSLARLGETGGSETGGDERTEDSQGSPSKEPDLDTAEPCVIGEENEQE